MDFYPSACKSLFILCIRSSMCHLWQYNVISVILLKSTFKLVDPLRPVIVCTVLKGFCFRILATTFQISTASVPVESYRPHSSIYYFAECWIRSNDFLTQAMVPINCKRLTNADLRATSIEMIAHNYKQRNRHIQDFTNGLFQSSC